MIEQPEQSGLLLPLTLAQRGLWNAERLGSVNTVVNIAEAIEIRGPVNIGYLQQALARLALECEPIRSRIVERDGEPWQLVLPDYPASFPVVDLSGQADPVGAAMATMMQLVLEPVDLARDPLWISALFRTDAETIFWYQHCHHIIGDGFSAGMMAQRVAAHYMAFASGEEAPPCVFGRLRELVDSEVAYRQSSRLAADRAYWVEQLRELPAAVTLSRSRLPSWGGLLRTTCHLPSADLERLKHNVREAAVSLPQLMTALIATYFHLATGADDIVVKMPVSGRMSGSMRRVPGMVANAVPLRLRFQPGTTFRALVRDVKRLMHSALRHQLYRYEHLRQDLGFVSQRQQICRLTINIEPFSYPLRFGDNQVIAHNLSNGSPEDLAVFVYDRGDNLGLRLDIDACPALYREQELAHHQQRLIDLLVAMPAHLDRPLDEIVVDGDSVRPRCGPGFAGSTVPELVAARAARHPDAIAVSVAADTSRTMTYGMLEQRVTSVAGHLTSRNLGPGDVVAVVGRPSEMLPVALLGVLRSGAGYVLLDGGNDAEAFAAILHDANPAAVLVLEEGSESAVPAGIPCIPLREAEQTLQGSRPPDPPQPDDVSHVVFACGGRSPRPRGISVAHWHVSEYLASATSGLRAVLGDRFLMPPEQKLGLVGVELFTPLVVGGQLVIGSETFATPKAACVEQSCEAERITFVLKDWRTLAYSPRHQSRLAARPAGAHGEAGRGPCKAFSRLSWIPADPFNEGVRSARWKGDPGDDRHAVPSVSFSAVPEERLEA